MSTDPSAESHKSYLISKYGDKAQEFLNDLEYSRGCEIVSKWGISRQLVSLHKKKLGFKGNELRQEAMKARKDAKLNVILQKRQVIKQEKQAKIADIIKRFNDNESVESIAKSYNMSRESMYQLIMRIRAVNKGLIGYRRKQSNKFHVSKYEINKDNYKLTTPILNEGDIHEPKSQQNMV